MMEPPSLPLQYKRTIGTDAGYVGHSYETKMTIFTLLRLHRHVEDFYLANNFSKGGKFDDLVFATLRNNQWESYFVQLKHSIDVKKKITTLGLLRESKAGCKNFSLPIYFKTFNDIKERFYDIRSTDQIFKNNFELSKFILYTNVLLDDEYLKTAKLGAISMVELSSKTNGQSRVFQFNEKVHSDVYLYKNFRNKNIKEFLNKLVLYTGQCSENEMNLSIENEIMAILKVDALVAKTIQQNLLEYTHDWYRQNSYFTKNQLELFFSNFNPLITTKPNREPVRFRDGVVTNLMKTLFNDSHVGAVACNEKTILCKIALSQAVLDSATFLTLEDIHNINHKNDQIDNWFKSTKAYLILDCDQFKSNFDSKLLCLRLNILKNNIGSKYVILMSNSENTIFQDILKNCSIKKINFNCSLKDLIDASRRFILEKEFSFQGYPVKITSVLGGTRTMDDVFTMNMMNDIISGNNVSVGVKPIEKINYYVSRVLERNVTFDRKILKAKGPNDIIAISCSNPEELQKIKEINDNAIECTTSTIQTVIKIIPEDVPYPFIILPKNEELRAFETLCELNKNVLWIEKNKNDFKWVAHFGEDLQWISYLDGKKIDVTTTENIMQVRDKIVLISAEPGMGKTTLIAHVASEVKKIAPSVWVVVISLNEFTNWFNKLEINEARVKDFLSEAAGVSNTKSKFDRRLFDLSFETPGKMFLFLDGFDEVVHYEEKIIQLLQILKKSKIEKIFITTRPFKKYLLEKELNSLAFTIKSFDKKDQKKFLEKYWSSQFPSISRDRLIEYIENVLTVAEKSFTGKEVKFTGIPLQTRMLAEAYQGNLKQFEETGVFSPPENISILELFEKFIQIKFDVMAAEKFKVDLSNPMARYDQERLNNLRRDELTKMALMTLFPLDQLGLIVPPVTEKQQQELKQMFESGLEGSGIVLRFGGDIPEFIHRTFAEYFAAKFFSTNIEANKEFIRKYLQKSTFVFVKYLFDRMLAKELPLHMAVIDENFEKFQELVQKVDINQCDLGGRTPAHLATTSKTLPMLVQLLACGINVQKKDKIMEWLPIQFADDNYNCEAVGHLLEIQPNSSQYLTNILKKKTGKWHLFKIIFKNDFIHLFKFLKIKGSMNIFDNKVTNKEVLSLQAWFGEDKKMHGLTVYHLAAGYGAGKIMQEFVNQRNELPIQLQFQFTNLCLDLPDDSGKTPLHYAAMQGNKDIVVLLTKNGVNVNAKDTESKTPIHYAAMQGHGETVQTLCSLADITLTDKDSKNALIHAAEKKHYDVVKAIVTFVKANIEPNFYKQAFEIIIKSKEPKAKEMVLLFLRKFPELINVKDKRKNTLLMNVIKASNCSIVQQLIAIGVPINDVNIINQTALHVATQMNCSHCIELLLKNMSDINVSDDYGNTPLYNTARHGNKKVMELLVSQGANVHCINNDGNTLLHAVTEAKITDREIYKYLILKEVDYNIKNKKQQLFDQVTTEEHFAKFISLISKAIEFKSSGLPFVKVFELLEESFKEDNKVDNKKKKNKPKRPKNKIKVNNSCI